MWWTQVLALLSKIPTAVFGLFTGVNLNSVGTALKSLLANIYKYWYVWLIAVLVTGNIFTTWEWRRTDALLVKERVAHATDIASFKQAQAEADRKVQMERSVLQRESKANADQADANYSGLLVKYRASLMRYSQNNGNSSQPNHNQLPTTQSGNGSGASPQLPSSITITGADADICAVNTARLQSVHDWALSLQKDGANNANP